MFMLGSAVTTVHAEKISTLAHQVCSNLSFSFGSRQPWAGRAAAATAAATRCRPEGLILPRIRRPRTPPHLLASPPISQCPTPRRL
jgi:hypothetical protein